LKEKILVLLDYNGECNPDFSISLSRVLLVSIGTILSH